MRRRSDADVDSQDSAWFEDVFHRYHPAILAFACRRVPTADADDVVADVFVIAWRRRADIPGDRVLSWLYGVATREVLHHYRSDLRRKTLDTRASRLEPAAVDHFAAVDARLSAEPPIRRAMSRLSEPDAEVLRLWAWEQLEPADIARALAISPVSARVRLHRARRRLEAHLRAAGSTAGDHATPYRARDGLLPHPSATKPMDTPTPRTTGVSS